MSGFERHRSGRIIADFSGLEGNLLRSLASQMCELLRDDAPSRSVYDDPERDPLEQLLDVTGPTAPPEDPVLRRLLPSAYADDEAAGEFRRYTEPALRQSKEDAAGAIIGELEDSGLPTHLPDEPITVDVELERSAAMEWLRGLADLRLALATRLEIEQDDEARWHALPDDDPQAQAYGIYEWLGYLQETLVLALSE